MAHAPHSLKKDVWLVGLLLLYALIFSERIALCRLPDKPD